MSKPPPVYLVRSNEPRTAANLRPDHFVHRKALEHLAAELASRVAKPLEDTILRDNDRLLTRRVHDAILIYGTRGSGKTTFMVDFMQLVQGTPDRATPSPLQDNLRAVAKHTESLGILDPTLLHQPQNLILLLVALIRDVVVRHLQERSGADAEGKYRPWLAALKDLAKSIDGTDIGRDRRSEDGFRSPDEIMESGFRRMLDGHSLEKNFHRFVETSLKVLDKRAFTIVLDDIDTQFDSGWHVLETLRKYCTTPQLIVMVLGDLELYTMRVRSAQLETLGVRLRKDEVQRKPSQMSDRQSAGREGSTASTIQRHVGELSYDRMVESLQSQYLIKVLPPSQRIKLATVWHAVQARELEYIVAHRMDFSGSSRAETDKDNRENIATSVDEPNTTKLLTAFEHLLETEAGFTSSASRNEALSVLLSQPLRTIVNLLPPIDLHRQNSDELPADSVYHRNQFCDRLTQTLADALIDAGVSPSTLHNDELSIVAANTKFLTHNSLWMSGQGLQVRGQRETLALASITLSAWANSLIRRSPACLFDYLLRFGGTNGCEELQPGFANWARISSGASSGENLAGKLVAWRAAVGADGSKQQANAFKIPGGTRVYELARASHRRKSWSYSPDKPSDGKLHLNTIRVIQRFPGYLSTLHHEHFEPTGQTHGELSGGRSTIQTRLAGEWQELFNLAFVTTRDDRSGFTSVSIFPVLEFLGKVLRPKQEKRVGANVETSASKTRNETEPAKEELHQSPASETSSAPKGAAETPRQRSATEVVNELTRFNARKSRSVRQPGISLAHGAESELTEEEEAPDAAVAATSDAPENGIAAGLGAWSRYWNERFRTSSPPSIDSDILARAWGRFEDALLNQSKTSPNAFGAGHVLHLQCVALFNAVLIEEALTQPTAPAIRFDNVLNDDRVFNENLVRTLDGGDSGKSSTAADERGHVVASGLTLEQIRESLQTLSMRHSTKTVATYLAREPVSPDHQGSGTGCLDTLAIRYPVFALIASCPIWLAYLAPELEAPASIASLLPPGPGDSPEPIASLPSSVAFRLVQLLSRGFWNADGPHLELRLGPKKPAATKAKRNKTSSGVDEPSFVPNLYPMINLVLQLGLSDLPGAAKTQEGFPTATDAKASGRNRSDDVQRQEGIGDEEPPLGPTDIPSVEEAGTPAGSPAESTPTLTRRRRRIVAASKVDE